MEKVFLAVDQSLKMMSQDRVIKRLKYLNLILEILISNGLILKMALYLRALKYLK